MEFNLIYFICIALYGVFAVWVSHKYNRPILFAIGILCFNLGLGLSIVTLLVIK